MARKWLIVPVLMAVIMGGIFAQPAFQMSAGAGGLFEFDGEGGVEGSASYMGQSAEMTTEDGSFGGGGYAFLDVTYAEISFGISGGDGIIHSKTENSVQIFPRHFEDHYSILGYTIGLLGKYPFRANKRLSFFPLLGIEYQIKALIEDEKYDFRFGALWFKFGAGIDYSFTEKVFLRFGALYGIRLEGRRAVADCDTKARKRRIIGETF
jgi:hypothetical protein